MATQVPVLSSKLTLFGAWFCPFVHRSVITLLDKEVGYNWVEIDLKDKPEWFLKINPAGKVPVIGYTDGDVKHLINESLTILEFLEDFQPEPAMLPSHPAERAHSRNIIAWFGENIIPKWYSLLRSSDRESALESGGQFDSALEQLQDKMSPEGPYFLGERFSLVDAAVLPWLLRLPLLKYYRGYQLPSSVEKLKGYIEACKKRPSVEKSLQVAPSGANYDEEMNKVYALYGGKPFDYFSTSAA